MRFLFEYLSISLSPKKNLFWKVLFLGFGLSLSMILISACGKSSDKSPDNNGLSMNKGGSLAKHGVKNPNCGDVIYNGSGTPELLIVSDFPIEGPSKSRSEQMNEAIIQEMDNHNWESGEIKVAFQACNDADSETGLWSESLCRENAESYARDEKVIGVIGPYNSGCAKAMIPVLNKAPEGEVPIVSPGNTAICLTEKSSACEEFMPDSLYPSGSRNYARVIPSDAAQGAALAQWTHDYGYKNIALIQAKGDPTSNGQAEAFINAANSLRIHNVHRFKWRSGADNYRALMNRISKLEPKLVVLAGLIEQNGPKVISNKVSIIGSNEKVPLIAFDGFAQQATINKSGNNSRGMYVSIPGRASKTFLNTTGKRFVEELESNIPNNETVEIYAPYAGQAAEVLLRAIDKGEGNRSLTSESLFGIQIKKGILGSFSTTDKGDVDVNPISIFKENSGQFVPDEIIEPKKPLIRDAVSG